MMEMPQHKNKTHRGFDLLRSQTVQKEIRLHENGSLGSAKLAFTLVDIFFSY